MLLSYEDSSSDTINIAAWPSDQTIDQINIVI